MELQAFSLHILQPLLMYGCVQLVYILIQYLTVGIYVIVVVAIIAAVTFVLHLSYEHAKKGALVEHEERLQEELELYQCVLTYTAGGYKSTLWLLHPMLSGSCERPNLVLPHPVTCDRCERSYLALSYIEYHEYTAQSSY